MKVQLRYTWNDSHPWLGLSRFYSHAYASFIDWCMKWIMFFPVMIVTFGNGTLIRRYHHNWLNTEQTFLSRMLLLDLYDFLYLLLALSLWSLRLGTDKSCFELDIRKSKIIAQWWKSLSSGTTIRICHKWLAVPP